MKANMIFAGFIMGALAGVAAGLLFAPKTGKDTRHMLGHEMGECRSRATTYYHKIRHDSKEEAPVA